MKLKNFLLCSAVIAGLMMVVIPVAYASENNNFFVKNQEVVDSVKQAEYEAQMRDSLEQMLLDSVYDYVERRSPKMAPVVSEIMVDAALEKDFDICFMMAQTLIETAFGECGVGQSRKSIFGVKKAYKTYEDCIYKYVDLVQSNYLGEDKTVDDLLENYVTVGGARYCTNRSYEAKLRKAYDRIVENTQIKRIQDELRELMD